MGFIGFGLRKEHAGIACPPTRDSWITITSRALLFVYVMNNKIPGQLEDLWVI
jgi:hypothetical protein